MEKCSYTYPQELYQNPAIWMHIELHRTQKTAEASPEYKGCSKNRMYLASQLDLFQILRELGI